MKPEVSLNDLKRDNKSFGYEARENLWEGEQQARIT
jgi:hypothetical protein